MLKWQALPGRFSRSENRLSMGRDFPMASKYNIQDMSMFKAGVFSLHEARVVFTPSDNRLFVCIRDLRTHEPS